MRTAHSLLWGGGLCRGVSVRETETPRQRPLDRDPLDRDPPGQRSQRTETPQTEKPPETETPPIIWPVVHAGTETPSHVNRITESQTRVKIVKIMKCDKFVKNDF